VATGAARRHVAGGCRRWGAGAREEAVGMPDPCELLAARVRVQRSRLVATGVVVTVSRAFVVLASVAVVSLDEVAFRPVGAAASPRPVAAAGNRFAEFGAGTAVGVRRVTIRTADDEVLAVPAVRTPTSPRVGFSSACCQERANASSKSSPSAPPATWPISCGRCRAAGGQAPDRESGGAVMACSSNGSDGQQVTRR
jgi:hypothetical protein